MKWSYEVVATQDGAEAMSALRKSDAPSLAILDWMMPGMDGLEICRRVREVNKAIYIILLTSRGKKENVVEALRAGADDYLTKPSTRTNCMPASSSAFVSWLYRPRSRSE